MNIITLLAPILALFQMGGPQLTVKLHAEHDSIQPGGQTELVVEIKVPTDWHIYDPIILATGLPTEITFDLPPSATVDDLRFPAPDYTSEPQAYLSHHGRVLALATLHLAPDAPIEPLEIKASVFSLACKEACIPAEGDATLTLPVSTEQAQPAAEELFKEARAALPPPLATAEYLKGSRLLVSHSKIPAGGQGELIAIMKIKPGYHIQDRDPGIEGFIPAQFFIEQLPGITFDRDREYWPPPHIQAVEGVGNAREQKGEVVIRVPFTIAPDDAELGPVHLQTLFRYQTCKDEGACFMPMLAAADVTFEIIAADEPAVAGTDAILADLKPLDELLSSAPGGSPAPVGGRKYSLPMIFLFAFLGGVILNVMPCVLPVISLKIFSFVQQSDDDPQRILNMGLIYAAGILASFAILAAVMVTAGMAWGGLMQKPGFLIGLSAVVFAFSLSLFGVFEITLPGTVSDVAGGASAKEGYGGAFLNGIMTTLLATPCVGPFLGTAVGVLAQLPPLVGASGIMVVGVGLATPYVLLTAFPAWLRFLPKPGPWMITFKQITGFILLVVVLWLVAILSTMVKADQLMGTIGLFLAVGIGCWLIGKITFSTSRGSATTIWALALILMVGGGWSSFQVFAERVSKIPWQKWEPGIAETLSEEGYAVYVDYTASWCLTCQTNKRVVLETDRIAAQFAELGIYPIKADFTKFDSLMQQELRAHGRNGVPLNLVYSPNKPDQPIVLPELLTYGIVEEALKKTPPSTQIPDFWTPKEP